MRIIDFGGDLNETNLKGFTPLAYCSTEFLKRIKLDQGLLQN